jgi:hypothetical protein
MLPVAWLPHLRVSCRSAYAAPLREVLYAGIPLTDGRRRRRAARSPDAAAGAPVSRGPRRSMDRGAVTALGWTERALNLFFHT